MTPPISSRANPLIKHLRALSRRKYREQHAEFLIQGIQPVLHALEARADVRALIIAPELLTSEIAHKTVQEQERAGVRVVQVTAPVFNGLAERERPTGLAALMGMPHRTMDDLTVTAMSVFVALYEISNPGNLGTIIRTVDAIGGSGVILIGASADPYDRTTLSASRGALFHVPVVRVSDAGAFTDWSTRVGVSMVITSDQAHIDLWSSAFQLPLVLVFGNEGEGLPPQLLSHERAVRIPMFGAVDSLNLAVAAGVLLYEVRRRRLTEDGDVSSRRIFGEGKNIVLRDDTSG